MREILTGPDRGPPKFDWRKECERLQGEVDRLNGEISKGVNGWVAVSERLPDSGSVAIISGHWWGRVGQPLFAAVARHEGDGRWVGPYGEDDKTSFYAPTHWMPLPEAPK